MSDLEITRLCAEAIGYVVEPFPAGGPRHFQVLDKDGRIVFGIGEGWLMRVWQPLVDDAQAMALVKKFGLHIIYQPGMAPNIWSADNTRFIGQATTLNKAICECVAKMRAAK